MNKLYNRLLQIKAIFAGIRTSLKCLGLDYSGRRAEEYTSIADDIFKLIINDRRTDYSYAFVGWSAPRLQPPRAINAQTASYIFMNCSELSDASGITLNITSDKPNLISYCMGCLKMTVPPNVSFTGANMHVVRSYNYAYANCPLLTKATIYFGDGTQSATGERTDMASCFFNCKKLTDIEFKGFGSPKSLDLSPCTELSLSSVESLYNALMDVSQVTSGAYQITFAAQTLELMSDELKGGFAAKGWRINGK